MKKHRHIEYRMFGAVSIAAAMQLLSGIVSPAKGNSSYYETSCAACHITVSPTCNGCHAHGVHAGTARTGINLSGSTDKTTYGAGEQVTITINGGNQTGWVRALLYDQEMVEIASSTGPDAIGGGPGFPIVLSAPAPAKSGTYRWNAAWYGNRADTAGARFGPRWLPDPENLDHGQEVVATNAFTVVAGPESSIRLNPDIVDFGVVPPGSSVTRTVQVNNHGNALLSVSGMTLCSGADGQLTWTPGSMLVPPGESQELQVTYTPRNSRPPGCLRLFTNDPEHPETLLHLHSAPTRTP